jgi:8-oxo-dGTP pyrophosphatase MutT (NUDIX family)
MRANRRPGSMVGKRSAVAPFYGENVNHASDGAVDFDGRLRAQISENLAGHEVREHPLEGRRHAAVAVVVIDSDADLHGGDDTKIDRMVDLSNIPGTDHEGVTGRVDGTAGGAAMLLTRRGARLSAHARQWAFPGGRIDEGETPLEAALREMHEEVGLLLDESHLLGRLDDYPTRSGYVMSPFVFWADADHEPEPNPDEVESVHRIGFGELLRPDSPRFVEIPESDRPVVQIPIGGDLIHAPTGAIIYQFRAVALEGRSTRVDELEQPVFAWK